jgi:hypothetical protein
MSSFTIQRTAVCSGGNHHTFTLTAGARSVQIVLVPEDVTGTVTDDELRAAVAVLLKAKKAGDGLSNAQLLSAAAAGITVNL